MKTALLALLLLLTASMSVTATNPAWVKLDKKLINEVNALVNQEPAVVQQYFRKGSEESHNLGFGWKAQDYAAYGGYLTIKATCYYHLDTLIGYTIDPWLPQQKQLKSLYADLLATGFKVNHGVLPFRYHVSSLRKPLAAYRQVYRLPVASESVAQYMSPESGLVYGYSGGEAPVMLQNRRAFLDLPDSLSPDQIVLIMHAVNPASRLTAIEYYLKNKKRFADSEQLLVEQWIEVVFIELPKIESRQGCIGGLYDARDLVTEFSN